ncbi:MAG: hypothetical protein KJS83_03030 [Xanthomonadaceae bacterium]|nr:hypothetical protein [Xanthomonadaceae bacterium]MBU6476633.1 hypothetical protein [Xanthomonadaceae bacterium]MDE2053150.1 hypothetical protein [Xanthomonadaceae bacterium]MDE2224030.1 hypothetical protein [Xanthomonadaceae bacterium]
MHTWTRRAIAAFEAGAARSAATHLIHLNPTSTLTKLRRMANTAAQ